jgi:hypothetical protein
MSAGQVAEVAILAAMQNARRRTTIVTRKTVIPAEAGIHAEFPKLETFYGPPPSRGRRAWANGNKKNRQLCSRRLDLSSVTAARSD